MFDDILVPTDGSENSERAIDHAVLLASAFDATVHGVYVVNVTYAADFEGGIDSDSVLTALEREGQSAIDTIETRCEAAGVDVRTDLLEGRPAYRISEYAAEHDVDLVVMGTHGRSGVSRLLLGSITESVVRRTDKQVLTIPKDAPDPGDAYDEVLVATDGSEDARHATDTAVTIADAFGARLHGVYIIDANVTQSQMIGSMLEQEGTRAVDAVHKAAGDVGLDSITEVLEGTPHDEIVEYANDHDIDLIVVGSHGKGAFERTFLGSVSERTIRTAHQPVLVTRRPFEEE